jgi:hypothetical protein
MLVLIDALLILAMLFFLFLPISDRRTVRMRLCMVCALFAVFSVSVSRTPVVPVLLASISAPPGMVRVPHMHSSDPSSGFSPRQVSDIRLLHGQGHY